MRAKKVLSVLLATAVLSAMCAGCGGGGDASTNTGADKEASDSGSSEASDSGDSGSGDVKEFTAFFAVPGSEINDDNEIQQMIAEKTGAKVKETWLTGQTAEEAVGTLIAGGEYPDFIDGSDGMAQLYEAGALVALDDYIDKYPNIKEFLTEQE